MPDVNELPDLHLTLPEIDAVDPSDDTTEISTEPEPPKTDVEPTVIAPKDDEFTSDSIVSEPANQDSEQKISVDKKTPAVEQPPVRPAENPAAKPEAKKATAPKKVTTPVKAKPKQVAVVAAAKPKTAVTPKAVAQVVTVAKPKPVAPKVPAVQEKKIAVPPKQEIVEPVDQKQPAETGGEAGTDK